ncbi:MAG: hypothetical protein IPG89_10410 [Bacteroidetes bacterium]|nr:hypothetical protein [Bacteroidota bacterium]
MSHTGDNVLSFLKQAVTKIEELQVQTALGKAELSEKFEEIKKEAREKVNDIKAKVTSEFNEEKEEFNHVKGKLEHLEVQLALGEAETMDALKEQKKNFKETVNDIKNMLTKD